MATANTSDGLSNDDAGSRRERPLFPSNRKLRHLQGVSVRNLIVNPPSRIRGKTIDDEDIPNSVQSPSKILARNESRPLHQSRSFSNLQASTTEDPSKHIEQRPLSQQARRTSILPWSDPDPQVRQVKLEDITRSRMATTWFSIHCDNIDEPVYVSEVVEDAMNPSFRAFDLNICGPLVSRLDHLTLKLWAKTAAMDEYMVLVELQVHLQSLQFLGRSLDSFHQPLPTNAILFHFPDGVYASLTDFPPVVAPFTPRPKSNGTAQSTSSYDALMRLANLDECIQDALITRERLESQISSLLEKNQYAVHTTSEASRAQDRLSRTRRAVSAERKQLRLAGKRKEELIASIKARREAMERGTCTREKVRCHLPDAKVKLASSTKLLDQNTEESKGQIRRISEDLLDIYPIEPTPDKPLAFTIRGLALPNSNFTDIDRDAVAAALGYAAHLVYLLSFYLSIPVPYPIRPYLSASQIQDPVSISLPQRTFPLHPVNVQYRFEYGVFLLNKDIEFLLNKQGLRVLDIRHTLPNLKYLLYVLTAQSSEIPARKVGGIRGLLPGRWTPSLSRRGSEDSAYSEPMLPRRVRSPLSKSNGEISVDKGKQRVAPGGVRGTSASFVA
ncbi:UV radiation resistance protein and autophagy-related subunit 14-domain-containing protein [Aspergillus egyptiacus]|nr:UV radiation resistance protein and autophagy-related subunit 14-domain-containing protein [Aspergillus egyptiacus]